jgi:hypothetical protein
MAFAVGQFTLVLRLVPFAFSLRVMWILVIIQLLGVILLRKHAYGKLFLASSALVLLLLSSMGLFAVAP